MSPPLEEYSRNPEDSEALAQKEAFDDTCREAIRVLRLQNRVLDEQIAKSQRIFDPANRFYFDVIVDDYTLELRLSLEILISSTEQKTEHPHGTSVEETSLKSIISEQEILQMLQSITGIARASLLDYVLPKTARELSRKREVRGLYGSVDEQISAFRNSIVHMNLKKE